MKPINWDELFRKHAAQLKGVCRRYVGDPAIAEDLVQETFMTAIDKIATFRGNGSLEGWIRKIAVNKALLYLRESKLVNVPAETLMNTFEQETEMENQASKTRYAIEKASFSADELLTVIDALPMHHKVVFNMYVLDGFSHKQIATTMNISTGTSKSHLARARKKAQELLYAKATEQQPVEARNRSAWWLLLFFQQRNIDTIFRKDLGQYELPAQTPTSTFPQRTTLTLNWTATSAGKVALSVSTISMFAAGSYLAVQLLGKPMDTAAKQPPFELNCTPAQIIATPPDTFKLKVEKPTKALVPAKAKKEKVIVKKTIVVRDTIRLEKSTSK